MCGFLIKVTDILFNTCRERGCLNPLGIPSQDLGRPVRSIIDTHRNRHLGSDGLGLVCYAHSTGRALPGRLSAVGLLAAV